MLAGDAFGEFDDTMIAGDAWRDVDGDSNAICSSASGSDSDEAPNTWQPPQPTPTWEVPPLNSYAETAKKQYENRHRACPLTPVEVEFLALMGDYDLPVLAFRAFAQW